MQPELQVLHEVVRLQVLVLAARSHQRKNAPVTVAELADWLRVSLVEGAEILQEMQDEGLVTVRRLDGELERSVVFLTPVGQGWIEWMHRQARSRPR